MRKRARAGPDAPGGRFVLHTKVLPVNPHNSRSLRIRGHPGRRVVPSDGTRQRPVQQHFPIGRRLQRQQLSFPWTCATHGIPLSDDGGLWALIAGSTTEADNRLAAAGSRQSR
jgi:hypothetical protein